MKKRIIIIIIIVCIVFIGFGLILINKNREVDDNSNKYNTTIEEKTIYNTTYYFGFGSRRVKINENGDVFDDLEIEDPNHKVDYKYVKTLSQEQLNSLKSKLQSTSNKSELDEFVIELVYGVKQFDNFGRY